MGEIEHDAILDAHPPIGGAGPSLTPSPEEAKRPPPGAAAATPAVVDCSTACSKEEKNDAEG